jgi:hypothetical protein
MTDEQVRGGLLAVAIECVLLLYRMCSLTLSRCEEGFWLSLLLVPIFILAVIIGYVPNS